MKRIVKRTTTTEEWVDPGDEKPLDAADEDETEGDDADEAEDEGDEPEDEPKPTRRRR